ncbi:MAG: RidA family protein [Sedimentisphaerales bacterium]|nr:RidA family protein [Sedimentisphaerales bacterium]
MSFEAKLHELGIALPSVAPSVGAYLPTVQAGNLLFISGQLPSHSGKILISGKVGQEVELNHAQDAARLCAINALAAIKAHLGTLDAVKQIIRLEIYVNSAPGFTEQSQVANGASNLLHNVFGPAGQHARLAIGVAEIPLNGAVELAMIVEIKN